jgi:predicted GH43/DUF377 family glycosyl hydrolase
MQSIYEETKTPYKYGIIIPAPENGLVDCPNVFRHHGKWYMLYVQAMNKIGYETFIASSDNLLDWTPMGKVLSFQNGTWDQWQNDGGLALFDHQWGGTNALRTYDNKYWLSYIGGALQGYETDPLSIGIAWTTTPDQAVEWNRIQENPVLGPDDVDTRDFEKKTLYKSNIILDDAKTFGHPFVMYYNGKQAGKVGTERIGMAVSDDMIHWKRFGSGPVIDNGARGISGDPQITKIGDVWVMFYFGHVWQPKAFDTFACSYDLVNWTLWKGKHHIEPTEPWDATFAHKPWVIKHDGVVYHYYCAVGDQGRAIAVATSVDLRSK